MRSAAVVVGLSLLSLGWRPDALRVEEVASPAGRPSGEPFLAAGPDGSLYLSWLEELGEDGHALRFARWHRGSWSAPRTIHSSPRIFANWADFPSLLALSDGSLAVHWLEKSGDGPYEYDAWVARSPAGGASWSEPARAHEDRTLNEHGFVSLVDRGQGEFAAVWLDGRHFGREGHPDEMTLMFRSFGENGPGPEVLLDGRVCDCCQTAAAATPNGIFVAYRDRSEHEIRDISFLRYAAGAWSEPRTLHPDGWEIAACPVNGPAVAALERQLAVAWFTYAGERGRVQVLVSENEGESFGEPVPVDDGSPIGRVDVEWLSRERAVVTWVEQTASGGEIRARTVGVAGERGDSFLVARTSSSRASGFPRLARSGDRLWIAWTDAQEGRVRVAQLMP